MNWPLRIARRYMFAKKSTNAINVITGISVVGLAIGTAALLLVMAVFNGFEDTFEEMFNVFNPDLKVMPIEGKTFEISDELLTQLKQMPGVEVLSETLEEIAVFEHKNVQDYAILKGVDDNFARVTRIDSVIIEGDMQLEGEEASFGLIDFIIYNKLGLSTENFASPISVYMARRKQTTMGQPFIKRFIYPGGVFLNRQNTENRYVYASLDFVRELLKFDDQTVSAIEIRVRPDARIGEVKSKVAALLGSDLAVKDRREQDADILKILRLERWMAYALACLTLILVAFNMVGCLWMIVLDKQKDIAILKSMGADNPRIRQLFLSEGILLTVVGLMLGIGLALLIYFIQKSVGIVSTSGLAMEEYPSSLRPFDFLVVGGTVLIIGLLASLPAAIRAARVSTLIREE